LKVLLVTARADWGGGPEHVFQLLSNLPDNIIPYVACPTGDEPYGVQIQGLVGRDRVSHIPHRKFSLTSFFRLLRFCQREKIDVLHSHGAGGGIYSRLIALLLGIPVLHSFHGVHFSNMVFIKRHVRLAVERLLGRLTTLGLAVSESESCLVSKFKILPESKIVIVENGVSIPDISHDSSPCSPYKVAHFTRFDPIKNSTFIFDVLVELNYKNRVSDFIFEIYGDGEEKEFFINKLKSKNFESFVTLKGFVSKPAKNLSGTLCYFSSSIREGMPLSLLEALASAVPVIASDVEGNKDLIKHEVNGLLFPLGRADIAASHLCKLADSPELVRVYGNHGRVEVSARHSVNVMAKRIAAIYQQTIRNS
jgi:glycosyltransferase involved in cell wall biosynthesis